MYGLHNIFNLQVKEILTLTYGKIGLILQNSIYQVYPTEITPYHKPYECKSCGFRVGKKKDECRILDAKIHMDKDATAPIWCPINNGSDQVINFINELANKNKEDLH